MLTAIPLPRVLRQGRRLTGDSLPAIKLHVLARDTKTGKEKIIEMKSAVDVSDEAVESMLAEVCQRIPSRELRPEEAVAQGAVAASAPRVTELERDSRGNAIRFCLAQG